MYIHIYIYIHSIIFLDGIGSETVNLTTPTFFPLKLTWNQLIFFKQSISTVVFFVDCIRFRKVGTNNTSDVCWFINPIISTSSIYPQQNHSCWTYEPTNQSPLEAPCHVEKTRIPVETTVSRWSKDLHKSLQQPSRITGQLGIVWIKLVCFSMRNPMLCGVSNVEEHSSRSPWLILCHWQSIIVNKYIYTHTMYILKIAILWISSIVKRAIFFHPEGVPGKAELQPGDVGFEQAVPETKGHVRVWSEPLILQYGDQRSSEMLSWHAMTICIIMYMSIYITWYKLVYSLWNSNMA